MPGKKISLSFLATAVLISGCAVKLAQPVLPTPAAPPAASGPVLPTTRIPLTWSGLNLSGQLVFLSGTTQDNDPLMVLEKLDLATVEHRPALCHTSARCNLCCLGLARQ